MKKRQVLLIVFVGTIATTGAFLLGYFLRGDVKESNEKNAVGAPTNRRKDTEVAEAFSKFKQTVRTRELENNLRFFSKKPHVAGSLEQLKLANYLASKWREYEFDEVEILEYKVLLSYPMENNSNVVSIVENGTIVEERKQHMKVSPSPGGNNTSLYTPYIAYSPNGTAEGPLVYVNRGTKEDLDELEKRNVSLNGTILLSRNVFGMKITSLLAIPKGAKGLLVYKDPEEYVRTVPHQNSTYPDGPWLSPKAVMIAQMYTRFGDPLTPGFPSLDGIYRTKVTDIKDNPPLLVQPLSYGDARWLLQQMSGDEVPLDWRGGLNVTYRFGPGFKNSSRTVRLSIHNQLKSASIYNVIGTITGREQPDRYVFLGNHRDAWFYGAADASTGASVLTETSRVLGVLLKGGWRPRRTIKLCSFGGEEFGLLGSVEWVEENAKILKDRGVAYLNTDVPVQGDYVLLPQTSPLLSELILKWTKLVKVPAAQGTYESIYDVMVRRAPSPVNPGEPNLPPFKFASDYIPFYFIAGVTAADFSYFFNYENGTYQLYPSYHTQEDTFYWVKNFVDPQFKMHQAMTLLMGGMLLDLADAKIIPFNVTWLKQSLFRAFNALKAKNVILANQIKRSLEEFSRSCDSFQSYVEDVRSRQKIPATTLRTINDQLSHLEKAFIDSRVFGANSVIFKHVAFSDGFNGVLAALASSLVTNDTSEVQKQLSIVSVAISSAAKILKPIVFPSK